LFTTQPLSGLEVCRASRLDGRGWCDFTGITARKKSPWSCYMVTALQPQRRKHLRNVKGSYH